MSIVVFICDQSAQVNCHVCTKTITVIGRTPENDIILDDPSISKRHCMIEVDHSQHKISDLNSSNGVFLNGEKIASTQTVRESDLIQIMDFSLMFRSLTSKELQRFESGVNPEFVMPTKLAQLQQKILGERSDFHQTQPGIGSLDPLGVAVQNQTLDLGLNSPLNSNGAREPSSLNSIHNALSPATNALSSSQRQPSSLNSIFEAVSPKSQESTEGQRQPSSLNSIFEAVTPKSQESTEGQRRPSSLNSIFEAVTPKSQESTQSQRQPSSLNSIFEAVTPKSQESTEGQRQPSSLNSIFEAVTPNTKKK